MKLDLYSKVVLTVIATSVFWLAAQNSTSLRVVSAQGSAPAQRVMLVDSLGNPFGVGDIPVQIRFLPTVDLRSAGSGLEVKVKDGVEVKITNAVPPSGLGGNPIPVQTVPR